MVVLLDSKKFQNTMQNLKSYITQHFNFSAEEIEKIVACFKPKTISKKDYFLKEGQYCKNVGLCGRGKLFVLSTN